ncbi:basic proline-rich protein-like [Alligator mississippiensis]|uniref:basic proline-rich protein-like n=1 Tax=Alligator mississippiensis TaxID=8496 RepID=UPI0028776F46|nr:basic proline-rich protein-like [Alligator mississippiensis]
MASNDENVMASGFPRLREVGGKPDPAVSPPGPQSKGAPGPGLRGGLSLGCCPEAREPSATPARTDARRGPGPSLAGAPLAVARAGPCGRYECPSPPPQPPARANKGKTSRRARSRRGLFLAAAGPPPGAAAPSPLHSAGSAPAFPARAPGRRLLLKFPAPRTSLHSSPTPAGATTAAAGRFSPEQLHRTGAPRLPSAPSAQGEAWRRAPAPRSRSGEAAVPPQPLLPGPKKGGGGKDGGDLLLGPAPPRPAPPRLFGLSWRAGAKRAAPGKGKPRIHVLVPSPAAGAALRNRRHVTEAGQRQGSGDAQEGPKHV